MGGFLLTICDGGVMFIDDSPYGYFLPWFIVSGFDILFV
jgi:hypothetical protein